MNGEGTTFFSRAKNIQISVRISMALFIPLGRYGDELFESQRDFKNVLVVILGIIIVGYGFGL